MSKGNYATKPKAELHARFLRKHFPQIQPIRVVKADQGYDVITSKGGH